MSPKDLESLLTTACDEAKMLNAIHQCEDTEELVYKLHNARKALRRFNAWEPK